jgi:hypothetical protein
MPDAEAQAVRDMPKIPLWFYRDAAGWSAAVTGVKLSPFGWVLPWSIKAA